MLNPTGKCCLGYLPPIKNKLLLQPAIKLAEQIKSGKLKSEDLIKCYIERCKEINFELNAIIDDNFDEALKQAREIDKRIEKELKFGEKGSDGKSINDFPFLGVPFTAKNSLAAKGKNFSGGMVYRKNLLADEDCEVIKRMKQSGAIFLALTNIPEMAYFFDSFNKVNGQTNNPYDKSRMPGGSSGGEGALISACGSVFGVGSDVAGSIRLPGHFNGIFSHYTTPNIIPMNYMFPPITEDRKKLLTLGPLCRYACDLRPMLKVYVGDQLDLTEKPLNYSNLNVYYLRQLDDSMATPVDIEIQQGLDKLIKYFIDKGTRTIELNMNKYDTNSFYELRYALAFWSIGMNDPKSPSFEEFLTNGLKINPYWELIKCFFNKNSNYTSGVLFFTIMERTLTKWFRENEQYQKMLIKIRKRLHQLLGDNGILICPTFPEIAPKHNQTLLKVTDFIYTMLWSPMNVAITNVPMGCLDRHGLPFGFQIIASPKNDNLTIQVAEDLEKQFGGWIPPCSIQLNN